MIKSDLGPNYDSVIRSPKGKIIEEVYKNHTKTVINSINKKFPNKNKIICADFGGGNGTYIKELKENIKKELIFTNIDKNQELLDKDIHSNKKRLINLEDINESEFNEKFDLIIMRYVLNYNPLEIQDKIIRKVKNLLKNGGIFILHHCGTIDIRHKEMFNAVFSTNIVSQKMIRSNPYWATWKEVQDLLINNGFKVKIIEKYDVPIGDLYKERNKLTEDEDKKLHTFLGKYDFIDYIIAECKLD